MVLKDGKPHMAFGVMGAHFQPMGHVYVMSNMFDYGMDPQEALDCPRVFFEGDALHVEETVPEEVVAGLKRLGHRVAAKRDAVGRRADRGHGSRERRVDRRLRRRARTAWPSATESGHERAASEKADRAGAHRGRRAGRRLPLLGRARRGRARPRRLGAQPPRRLRRGSVRRSRRRRRADAGALQGRPALGARRRREDRRGGRHPPDGFDVLPTA